MTDVAESEHLRHRSLVKTTKANYCIHTSRGILRTNLPHLAELGPTARVPHMPCHPPQC